MATIMVRAHDASPPARVLFVTGAPPDGLAGGVKVAHRHAELLVDLGIDAQVLAPRGRPVWFRSKAVVTTDPRLRVGPSDLLVFGEEMDRNLDAARPLPCQRALYCQNHHYLPLDRLNGRGLAEAGFHRVAAASRVIGAFLDSAMGWPGASVLSPPINPALFRPGPKTLRVAVLPRKLPEHAAFIRAIFRQKNPDLAGIEWVEIVGRHEEEVADILAGSAVFLSLGHREGLGMVALEAMASGCAVVGFHGMGGLDYATPENGRWFFSDDMIACADALADVLRGLEGGDSTVAAMIQAGQTTAAAHAPDRVKAQLLAFYGAGA